MNLPDWLARIEALRPELIRLGLERIAEVAARLGIASLPGRVITVAGTNGKGSTLALLDELARASGKSTSLYTSPHLFRFNERICQQGRPVADADLCAAFEAVEAARGDTPLTYFEFTTLAAFWLFRQQPTDLYLLEVGLGGRLDAVNLLAAEVAVITSIGLDHTDWLGDTRDAIGREKSGIARAGRPLLYGERDMPASVEQVCHEVGAQLQRAGRDFGFDRAEQRLFWGGQQLPLAAPVWLGEDNLATALQALAQAGVKPTHENIVAVAARARLKGRCEQHWLAGVEWIFDVGHNREAMARVAERLPPHAGRTLALCAMLADKPAEAVLSLVSRIDHWWLANLPGARGGGVERLAALLPTSDSFADVSAALAALKAELVAGDRVLVTGSFMTVMRVQELLGLTTNTNEKAL